MSDRKNVQNLRKRPPLLWLINNWATCVKQDAQLSQKDRAAGCIIVFAKSGRLEPADNILRTL